MLCGGKWRVKLVGSPQASARMSFILQLSYHSHFEARSWEWLFKRRLGTKIGVCSCTVCSSAQVHSAPAQCTVCSSYVSNVALFCTISAHHALNFALLILQLLCWTLIMNNLWSCKYVVNITIWRSTNFCQLRKVYRPIKCISLKFYWQKLVLVATFPVGTRCRRLLEMALFRDAFHPLLVRG